MRTTLRMSLAAASLALVACSKPERVTPDAGPPPTVSDEPLDPDGFPNVDEGQKLIMSGFGKIVVPDGYQDSDAGLPAPKGMTLDTSYVKKIDDLPVGRFAISHREEPGSAVGDPVIADMADAAASPAPCPGLFGGPSTKAGDVATKEFVRGVIAHYRCAKLSFGGGLVATLRKDERVYELVCVASGETGIGDCIAILRQLRPS